MFRFLASYIAANSMSNRCNLKIIFQGSVEDVGRIGLLMMISGVISSLVMGKLLDKTRLFK